MGSGFGGAVQGDWLRPTVGEALILAVVLAIAAATGLLGYWLAELWRHRKREHTPYHRFQPSSRSCHCTAHSPGDKGYLIPLQKFY